MKQFKKIAVKSVKVKVDKSLDAYLDKGLFKEKVKKPTRYSKTLGFQSLLKAFFLNANL
jgi:hypothetical protein